MGEMGEGRVGEWEMGRWGEWENGDQETRRPEARRPVDQERGGDAALVLEAWLKWERSA